MKYYKFRQYDDKLVNTAIKMLTEGHSVGMSICNKARGCEYCMFKRSNNFENVGCAVILGDENRDVSTSIALKNLLYYKALYECKRIKRKE